MPDQGIGAPEGAAAERPRLVSIVCKPGQLCQVVEHEAPSTSVERGRSRPAAEHAASLRRAHLAEDVDEAGLDLG
jgi:hypothetical protein